MTRGQANVVRAFSIWTVYVWVTRLWTIWRDDPDFAQRFEATVDADRRRIEGRWERRAADGPWEHDFAVAYTRP